jgi:probable HAF family extracellular repeat protein
MRHACIRVAVLAAGLFAVLPLRATPLAPGPVDLGTLGGSPFPVHVAQFNGFGRKGTVVGSTTKVGTGEVPFAWTSATGFRVITDQLGFGAGANNLGQVIGSLTPFGQPSQGFFWSPPGTLVAITSPLALAVYPRAVNDAGQVAGEIDATAGGHHAFLWTASNGLKDLGSLGGDQLLVTGMSGTGVIIGQASDASGNTHAFSWKSGNSIKDLGTLGGIYSYATAVNDAGTIVGYSQGTDFNSHGFVFMNNRMTALDSPTGTSVANAINHSGTIVGSSVTGGALIWVPGASAQVIPGIDFAVDINDNGRVAAYAVEPYDQSTHAFLWSASGGLVDAGSEDESSSYPLGVTSDDRLVANRVDWAGVTKVYVWKPGGPRALLDGLGGGFSRALFVNASGQVAGVSRTILGYDRAFVWSAATGMVEVPAPAGFNSTPADFNASGGIVGSTIRGRVGLVTPGPSFFWPGSGTTYTDFGSSILVGVNDESQVLGYANPGAAFVWSGGTYTTIPAAPGAQIVPAALNLHGQVVGYYLPTPFTMHAFSWKPAAAAIVDLGTLGGTHSLAVAVNASGQITGTSSLTGDVTSHAFRTTAGHKMTDLGSLFGATANSSSVAMNTDGNVTGYDTGPTDFHVFLYDGKLHDLGALGGSNPQIWGINDSKDVVGWRLDPATGPHAFVCFGGAPMTDLPAFPGQDSSQAFGINNAGDAVGNALLPDGQRRALIWYTR